MNHKIKNFLTFGMYDRLVQAECQVIQLKEAISKAQSTSSICLNKLEKIDVDQAIDAAIDNASIMTDNNFSPSDYDLVQSYDYDFDTFMNEDEVARVVESEMEDYRQKIDEDIRDNISEMQGRFIKDTIKETCTEMLVDWCKRTAEAANKQEATDSSSHNS